ncbi:MAG TPA: hypothetical protein VF712_04130 [Thermoleophilaceae bacterium]|jgi:hypothetical protein
MTTENPPDPAPRPADQSAADDARSKKLEVWIAALLGIVAVITAFATYKAVLEDGDTLANFNEGVRINDNATAQDTEGTQQYTTDQAIYLEFIKSDVAGDAEVAKYFRETLFSPELEEAVKWVEEGGKEAVSPFQEDSPYTRPEWAEAEKLRGQTEAKFKEAGVHDEDGDKYVLATVILSISLFLLGIAGVNRQFRVQRVLVAIASVVLVAGVAQILAVGL